MTDGAPRVAVARAVETAHATLDLARACLDELGSDTGALEIGHACRRCGGEDHGRPFLRRHGRAAPERISVSHCGRLVVVAVSDGAEVGIDVEDPEGTRFAGFDGVALHADEPRPLTLRERGTTWTRKEAYLKSLGIGLDVPPDSIRLTGPDSPPAVVSGVPGAGAVRLVDLELPAPLVGCVAVVSATPPAVVLTRAGAAAPSRPATSGTGSVRRLRRASPRTR